MVVPAPFLLICISWRRTLVLAKVKTLVGDVGSGWTPVRQLSDHGPKSKKQLNRRPFKTIFVTASKVSLEEQLIVCLGCTRILIKAALLARKTASLGDGYSCWQGEDKEALAKSNRRHTATTFGKEGVVGRRHGS
jgi:hypothetical protein